MNTKNYVYVFVIGLMCAAALMLQSLRVQAAPSVMDEVEKSVPSEELTLPEKPVEVQPPETPDETKPTEELNETPQADAAETEQVEEVTEEPVQEETKTHSLHVKEEVSVEPEQQKKSHHHFYMGFFSKIKTFAHNHILVRIVTLKNSFIKYLADKTFFEKTAKSESATSDDKKEVCSDFAPYYFIYPTYEGYDKAFFSDKVKDFTELMPYNMAVKNTAVKIDAPKNAVTSLGTTDIWVLVNAPSPQISVCGKPLFAKIVIDIRNNTLYKYDRNGFPLKAYLVATGARGTRTMPGLRIVTYKERFPYAGAPESKRALDPYSYGPYILFLNAVEPRTGRQYCVEQLLHGNGNEYSIGRKVSHGCVRTNNIVMKKELSKEVKRGDYVLLINPDID